MKAAHNKRLASDLCACLLQNTRLADPSEQTIPDILYILYAPRAFAQGLPIIPQQAAAIRTTGPRVPSTAKL